MKVIPILSLLVWWKIEVAVAFVQQHAFNHHYDHLSASTTATRLNLAAKSKEEDLELTRQVIAQFVGLDGGGGGSTSDAAPAASTEEEPKKQQKKAKKKKKKKPQPQADAVSEVIDISKLDIRVGVITKAWNHPDADKLYCEEIDIGEEAGPRSISSGLRAHYDTAEDLVNKRVLILSNLKTRKLVGFPSHGMVLCASEEGDDGKVELIAPPDDAAIGERIIADGYEGPAATENQVQKKKMLNTIFPDFNTNENGDACYKGVPLKAICSGGVCTSSLPNVPVG